MMRAVYQIAGVSIALETETQLIDDPFYAEYRLADDEMSADVSVIFQKSCDVPDFSSMKCLFRGYLNQVFRDQNQIWHVFHAPGGTDFAWNLITGEDIRRRTIYYEAGLTGYFKNSAGCFNALSIERVLHSFGKYIFHCCYVETEESAILFTAPSGGGKTTQGLLWEASGHGRIINGDRAVLEILKDADDKVRVLAHGLPIAGSSGVFINEVHPVRAIYVVNKSADNSISRLTGAKAFAVVYEQFIIHLWDPQFQMDVINFVEMLLSSITVCQLNCRIDQGAVDCVRNSGEYK